MPRARSVRFAKSPWGTPSYSPALHRRGRHRLTVRPMRDRRYRRLDGHWNDYNQAVAAAVSSRSVRLQAEAGEAVAGDLAGQFGLPAQIGAHRVLIAGMAVVIPENGIDAVFVRRV